MTRVIPDSDEEEEILISPVKISDPSPISLVPASRPPPSPRPLPTSLEGDSEATRSLKELGRHIPHAREDLSGSVTSKQRLSDENSLDPEDSPDMTRTRRTRTIGATATVTPDKKPKTERRKTMKTYGQSSRSDFFATTEQELEIFERYRNDVDTPSESGTGSLHSSAIKVGVPSELKGHAIGQQARLNWQASCHQSAGFPPPSSTVPNHTATQQRIIAAMQESPLDVEDELLTRHQTPAEQIRDPASLTTDTAPSTARLGPSQVRTTPDRHVTGGSPLGTLKKQPSSTGQGDDNSPIDDNIWVSGNATTGASDAHRLEGQHTDSSNPRPRSSARTTSKLESYTEHSSDPLNSDDAAIGLPKERYVPRPSRSRSSRALDSGGTNSAPTARRGRGRSTRQAADELVSDLSLSGAEKIQKIEDMGFSNSQAQRALNESDGHLEIAIDGLLCGEQLHSEEKQGALTEDGHPDPSPEEGQGLLIHDEHDGDNETAFQSQDLGLTQDGEKITHEDEELFDTEPQPLTAMLYDERLKREEDGSEIPMVPDLASSAPAERKAKRKRSKTTPHLSRRQYFEIDDSDDDAQPPQPNVDELVTNKRAKVELEETLEVQPDVSQPKKRTRGRLSSTKKRDSVAVEVHQDVLSPVQKTAQEKASETQPEPAEVDKVQDSSPLSELSANSSHEPHRQTSGAHGKFEDLDASPRSPAGMQVSRDDTMAPTASKACSTTPQVSSSAQHSPLKKSGRIFRVGLSRNARIAPLLRMVKK